MDPDIAICYTLDEHVAGEEHTASVFKVCIQDTQECGTRQNHDHKPLSSTIKDLQNGIDRLRGGVAHVTIVLHHLQPTSEDIFHVNIVAFELHQLVGWDELVLRLPEVPLQRQMEEASKQKDLLVSRTSLMGRTITFFGHRENVPAPWFGVGQLTRCGVAAVNLHCTLNQQDFAELLQSASANDNYSALPLKLFIKALDDNTQIEFLNYPPRPESQAPPPGA